MFLIDKVTKDKINEYFTDLEIFEHYTGHKVEPRKRYKCPFREDKNPSFIYSFRGTEIMFKDMASGESGNVIKLVRMMFGLDYKSALNKIYFDLVYNNKINYNEKRLQFQKETEKRKNSKKVKFTIRLSNYNNFDIRYWRQFGLDIKDLNKYNVKKLDYFKIIKPDREIIITSSMYNPIYCYKYGGRRYKIYRPFDKQYKWFANSNVTINYHNLPKTGETLIITKSYKDVMCIEKMGYHAISPHSEGASINHNAMKSLLNRFKNVYLLYDNDANSDENWGQVYANKVLKNYESIVNLKIPTAFNSKDISDFVKNCGFINATQWLRLNVSNNCKVS